MDDLKENQPFQTIWTHDPNGRHWESTYADRIWTSPDINGWAIRWLVEPNAIRCGIPYEGDENKPDFDGGSCGLQPGHECPHVWSKTNAQVISVSRATRVSVA